MEYITINNQKFLVMKNEKDAIDTEVLKNKMTDYFNSFDYVVGDWAYGKLRLKGFNSRTNKNFKDFNDIDKVEDYLKKYCAYQCKYFILAKENE